MTMILISLICGIAAGMARRFLAFTLVACWAISMAMLVAPLFLLPGVESSAEGNTLLAVAALPVALVVGFFIGRIVLKMTGWRAI